MIRFIKSVLFLMIALIIHSSLLASPTENEFEPCKKIAVAILKACLSNNENDCWKDSKAKFNACREKVFSRHTAQDEHQEAAQKEAKLKAMQATKQKEKRDTEGTSETKDDLKEQ